MTGHGYTDAERQALAEVSRYAAAADREGLRRSHDRVFRSLGAALVEERISGAEFEERFLELWRLYRDSHVATSPDVDKLFTDVDTYCGDPELWEEGDLDDTGLRTAVSEFLHSAEKRPD